MFEIHIERRAVKELERIAEGDRETIAKNIATILSINPYPRNNNPKRLKGSVAYRLRIGDFRVLYCIEQGKVLIYAIRNRKNAYR